jgi:hypothetical protein
MYGSNVYAADTPEDIYDLYYDFQNQDIEVLDYNVDGDLDEATEESYMISKSGSKSNPHYVLEKPDGSKQIDMMFSSPEEAKKYAAKKNIKVSSKTGYNMNEAKEEDKVDQEAKIYFMQQVKQGKIKELPKDPKAEYMKIKMSKDKLKEIIREKLQKLTK